MIRSDGLASWAHVLWQNHGLRMEEFYDMPPSLRHLYIASEQVLAEEKKKSQANAKK